jgi:hypothetical protein
MVVPDGGADHKGDGYPVLRLHDNSEGVHHVLMAMYHRKYASSQLSHIQRPHQSIFRVISTNTKPKNSLSSQHSFALVKNMLSTKSTRWWKNIPLLISA